MLLTENYIQNKLKENKSGSSTGIYSICTSNKFVIEAGLINAKKNDSFILIESTSNQVNQYGGYSGLTPAGFREYVYNIARELQFPPEKIILGGDHLGPNVWRNEPSETALNKAKEQIAAYVKAGYYKIHLDATMKCRDDGDRNIPLSPEIIADRTADLCRAAEDAFLSSDNEYKPVYVIGTDVPPPGGSSKEHLKIHITPAGEVDETIYLTKSAFKKRKLDDVWERIIAIVVQPGVEFGNSEITEYDKDSAYPLKKKIESVSEGENLVYEAHSTDYQRKESLKQMVNDHFAILKVGPWLTYAFREAVFALGRIEKELLGGKNSISDIESVIEARMMQEPKYWNDYYHDSGDIIALERKYSYSDRIRYYWSDGIVEKSLQILLNNLNNSSVPMTLLSQYLPEQYDSIRDCIIKNNPESIIHDKITKIIRIYDYATGN